jgi:lipoprotein signal peptidase
MRKRLDDIGTWVVAGAVLAGSELCSALVRRDIPLLNIHWVLKPILGIANAPTDRGFLDTTGILARLLQSGVVVVAAIAGVWLASRGVAAARSGWYRIGLGLFVGGAAANAYQLLVTGQVLDWITFRPLALLGLHEGLTTYSLGDAAVASGIALLLILMLITQRKSRGHAMGHAGKDTETESGSAKG